MNKYKLYTIKTILFLFIFEKLCKILNFVYNLLDIDITPLGDYLSILLVVFIVVPFTLIIIDFLFKK